VSVVSPSTADGSVAVDQVSQPSLFGCHSSVPSARQSRYCRQSGQSQSAAIVDRVV
jgi:hypothetical protein